MSCLAVLQTLVAKVTGLKMFATWRKPPHGPGDYLYIDPVGVIILNGQEVPSVTTIEMIVDYDIQIPACFTEKLSKSRAGTKTLHDDPPCECQRSMSFGQQLVAPASSM